jgi:hypothetical protein|tara:strand:+ start:199 stop:558 length:360 start_codon:yes stop_codon:yes gene_type:complete
VFKVPDGLSDETVTAANGAVPQAIHGLNQAGVHLSDTVGIYGAAVAKETGAAKIIPTAHYDPYILPVAPEFLNRTKDKYALTKVMSHMFRFEQVHQAFEQAEWAGGGEEPSINRAFLMP